ncbi:unnamed protein product [Tenebrio molitor]|nr:unnamed protein product [Tenebrio molitor]
MEASAILHRPNMNHTVPYLEPLRRSFSSRRLSTPHPASHETLENERLHTTKQKEKWEEKPKKKKNWVGGSTKQHPCLDIICNIFPKVADLKNYSRRHTHCLHLKKI